MNIVPIDTHALVFLVEAQLAAGRYHEAREEADRALGLVRAHRQRFVEAEMLRLFGDLHTGQEPPDLAQAETFYRQAVALADEMGTRPLLARCRLRLGLMLDRAGRPEDAREELTRAATMFREMGMRTWLDKAEGALRELGA
jgi:tetratricopeptide (TPR) repeat protein